MFQHTLIRRVENALQAVEAAAPLIAAIETIEVINRNVESRLSQIATGVGNSIADNGNALHSDFASLNNVTRTHNVRVIFQEIESLSRSLSQELCEGLEHTGYVKDQVLIALDEFAELYNKYVVHQTGINAVPLLLASRRVSAAVAALRGFLEYIRNNMSDLLRADGEAELSLALFKVSDVRDFAVKLIALQDLYDELSGLLDVSTSSHPLRIGKIESGSLWTRVFGDMKVIGLMVTFLEETTRYLHRNFTVEGKIASIPTKIEAMNSALDFTNRLKEAGVDVTQAHEALAKGAVSIADNLNKLISDQPAVEVNGKVLSAGAEIQQVLLASSAPKRLEYSATTDTKAKR